MKRIPMCFLVKKSITSMKELTDKEFMLEAQKEGLAYTKEAFDFVFKDNEVETSAQYINMHEIRVIDVMTFDVAYTVTCSGKYRVFANSLDEAIEITKELPMQNESELEALGDTFEIDLEGSKEVN